MFRPKGLQGLFAGCFIVVMSACNAASSRIPAVGAATNGTTPAGGASTVTGSGSVTGGGTASANPNTVTNTGLATAPATPMQLELPTPTPAASSFIPYHFVDLWYDWPRDNGGAHDLSVDVNVTVDPGLGTTYYFAHYFVLANNGVSGYSGLQTVSYENRKTAVFSMWGSTNAQIGDSSLGTCSAGADGASGFTCIMTYDWVQGHTYTLHQTKASSDSNGDWWNGYITDTTTGQSTLIAQQLVPPATGNVVTSVLFDEYFTSMTTCANLVPATVTFASLNATDTQTHSANLAAPNATVYNGNSPGKPNVNNCAGYFTMVPSASAVTMTTGQNVPAEWVEAGTVDCLLEGDLYALATLQQTSTTFTNTCSTTVLLYPLDESGARLQPLQVSAGTSLKNDAYVTTPYVVTDALGRCLGIYTSPPYTQTTLMVSASGLLVRNP